MRKPFWYKARQCWYVKSASGRKIRLDPNEETAFDIWQRMRAVENDLATPHVTVRAIVLAWWTEHRLLLSAENLASTLKRAKRFAEWCKESPAGSVRPSTVLEWLESERQWGGWAKRHAIAAVKRVFRWAHAEGVLPKNALSTLRLPEPEYRSRIITNDEHATLIRESRRTRNGRQFALYLIASHCGARPQQIREAAVSNIHQTGQAWVFQNHKTKAKTGKPLTVYLPPCLQTITKIVAAARGDGRLFLQESGKPWTKNTVTQRFRRLRERCGLSDAVAYSYRHTFATNLLAANVRIATVSALLGHTDTRMVSKVYGHIDQLPDHLVEAVAEGARHRHSG